VNWPHQQIGPPTIVGLQIGSSSSRGLILKPDTEKVVEASMILGNNKNKPVLGVFYIMQ
jgi:hypothetical protein